MKLWGGWLPFIGFRDAAVPVGLAREVGLQGGIPTPGRPDHIMIEAFQVEWFGMGCSVVIKACE